MRLMTVQALPFRWTIEPLAIFKVRTTAPPLEVDFRTTDTSSAGKLHGKHRRGSGTNLVAGVVFAEMPHMGSDSLVAKVHAVRVFVMRVLPPPLCAQRRP